MYTAGPVPGLYGFGASTCCFTGQTGLELRGEAGPRLDAFLEYCPNALLDSKLRGVRRAGTGTDKRFAGDAWRSWPFDAGTSQGFLFTQQWWHHATTGVKGVSAHHEDVASFVARQILDVVSPANFLLTNPEVLEATFEQGGTNLVRGGVNFFGKTSSALSKGRSQSVRRRSKLAATLRLRPVRSWRAIG